MTSVQLSLLSLLLVLNEQPCLCLVNGLFLLQLWVEVECESGKKKCVRGLRGISEQAYYSVVFSPVRELEEYLKQLI